MRGVMTVPVEVMITIDSNFCMQAGVLLASIQANGGGDVVVHLFGDGLDASDRERLLACCDERMELRLGDASDVLEGLTSTGSALRLPPRLTPISALRVLVAELMTDSERLIYLDADTMVLKPLQPLWETELGESSLGAIRDAAFPWHAQALPWRKLGLDPASSYFNSGVMVVPVERWRSQNVGRDAINLLQENLFRFGDQCALNIVLAEQWNAIDPKWNCQLGHRGDDHARAWVTEGQDVIDRAREDPAIVHYHSPAPNRPWCPDSRAEHADRWFELLDSTPWAGWRPLVSSPLERATRRTKAAIRRKIVARGW